MTKWYTKTDQAMWYSFTHPNHKCVELPQTIVPDPHLLDFTRVYNHGTQIVIKGLIYGNKGCYNKISNLDTLANIAPTMYRYKYSGLLDNDYSRQAGISWILSP